MTGFEEAGSLLRLSRISLNSSSTSSMLTFDIFSRFKVSLLLKDPKHEKSCKFSKFSVHAMCCRPKWKVFCQFPHWTFILVSPSSIYLTIPFWGSFVPIHQNTMEFNYVVLKPIFGAKVSNVNNSIYRNGGSVIYLSESHQQSWNLLWNVSHFGAIGCQSSVQNFKFCCWIQF